MGENRPNASAIALDIGGTNIKYALVDCKGKILYKSSLPTKDSKESLCKRVSHLITELLLHADNRALTVEGIGVGVPSVVDNGEILFCNNLPELNSSQLKEALVEFNVPVYIENDANAMAFGEIMYGAAKGCQDAVFLTVGTGIGGALLINGELYGGHRNRGTELGHIIIHGGNGKRCTCGAIGCLEAHASVSALISTYKDLLIKHGKKPPRRIDGALIVNRYNLAEEEAIIAMNDHLSNLALGIVGLINVFAPQKVIIGGGISESGTFYIEQLKAEVKRQVMKETSHFTRIVAAALGNDAGFLGAAALVFKHLN